MMLMMIFCKCNRRDSIFSVSDNEYLLLQTFTNENQYLEIYIQSNGDSLYVHFNDEVLGLHPSVALTKSELSNCPNDVISKESKCDVVEIYLIREKVYSFRINDFHYKMDLIEKGTKSTVGLIDPWVLAEGWSERRRTYL